MKKYLFLLIFLSLVSKVFCQESQTFLGGKDVTDLHKDGEILWVTTNGSGIYAYDYQSEKFQRYYDKNSELDQNFFHTISASDKYVFAGSTDGFYIFDKRRQRWIKRKFGKGGQLSNWIRDVVYDESTGIAWIGRFMYLTSFNTRTRRFEDYDLTKKGNPKTNTIKTIELDGDSLIWIGTEGGLNKYDKSKDFNEKGAVEFFDNSLNYFGGMGEEISVSDIYTTPENIWIGLDEFRTEDRPEYNPGGLYKYDRGYHWIRFGTEDGLDGSGILSIEKTGHYLWVSLYQFGKQEKEKYGRGLAILNIMNNKIQMVQNQKLPRLINKILFDGRNLWLAASDRLVKINMENEFSDFNIKG
jgi:hypothetical protein